MIVEPESVGEPVVLAKHYIRELVVENFRHPRSGEIYTRSLFNVSNARPVMIFPITPDRKVITLHQFRHGAKTVVIEIPGGNPKANQTDLDAAKSELREETGYESSQWQLICPKMWWEPDSLRVQYSGYLAADCVKTAEPRPSKNEHIQVEIFTIKKWLEMIWNGDIHDSKTIVLTMLALPYLGLAITGDLA